MQLLTNSFQSHNDILESCADLGEAEYDLQDKQGNDVALLIEILTHPEEPVKYVGILMWEDESQAYLENSELAGLITEINRSLNQD